MNKLLLGYISSALFLICGLFQFVANKPILGVVFVLVSIASVIIHIKLNRSNKKQ
jgi:hypothetical protein